MMGTGTNGHISPNHQVISGNFIHNQSPHGSAGFSMVILPIPKSLYVALPGVPVACDTLSMSRISSSIHFPHDDWILSKIALTPLHGARLWFHASRSILSLDSFASLSCLRSLDALSAESG
jgi:hypothetical protein